MRKGPAPHRATLSLSKWSSGAGFTLVELLLFTGIVGIMAGAIVSFSIFSQSVGTTNEVRAEVEQNGALVLERITRAVREADIIAYPPRGQTSDSLVLVRILSPGQVRETIVQAYHDYARIIETEAGTTNFSYITTAAIGVEQMFFLHFGSSASDEGVSYVFQMFNKVKGIEVPARQYVRRFRGSATQRGSICLSDSDCSGGTPTCCNGICGTNPCPTGGACNSIADCSVQEPYTDPATCRMVVPVCRSGACLLIDGGPGDECRWCGDGDDNDDDYGDPTGEQEECDDGCVLLENGVPFPPGCDDGADSASVSDDGMDGYDSCTRQCRRAFCSDGVVHATKEECDDGNLTAGDGCDEACKAETVCDAAIDIAFVVDTSSAAGQVERLAQIKTALTKFVQYLDFSRDRATVVSYGTTATVHQALTNNEASLLAAVDALSIGGNANMEQGIEVAEAQITGGTSNDVIVLIAANPPDRMHASADPCTWLPVAGDGCEAIAEAATPAAQKVFAVGIAPDANLTLLLQSIADDPDATYFLSATDDSAIVATVMNVTDKICACGNGTLDGGEACDDGNDSNYDRCTNQCTNAACGDTYLQPLGPDGIGGTADDEQCDDGGTVSGDGCSSTCLVESSRCGNGAIEGGERCDDGNTTSGDGCSSTCQPEIVPSCYTNNEVCLLDTDCYEPDTASCASCIDGQCRPGGGGCYSNGQDAADLAGQVDTPPAERNTPIYTRGTANNGEGAVNARGFDFPSDLLPLTQAKGDVVLDKDSDRLFVADTNNNRVLVFTLESDDSFNAPGASPGAGDRTADFVLGQDTFTANSPNKGAGVSASGLSSPRGLAYDRSRRYLYVADAGNNRVLVFDVTSITNGEAAIKVLGQNDFTSSSANKGSPVSSSGLDSPMGADVSFFYYDLLFVADTNNNRVLVFDVTSITDGENAVDVFGQADFTSNAAPNPPTAASMNIPQDVTLGWMVPAMPLRLFVADTGNHRVLHFMVPYYYWYFSSSSSSVGPKNAQNVLGQTTFTTNAAPSPPTAASMNSPRGVNFSTGFYPMYYMGGTLHVADTGNHRVLVFDALTIANGENAVNVIGQPNFTSATAATTRAGTQSPRGITGDYSTGGSSSSAMSMSSTANRLFVADSGNNRVTVYETACPTSSSSSSMSMSSSSSLSSSSSSSAATSCPLGCDQCPGGQAEQNITVTIAPMMCGTGNCTDFNGSPVVLNAAANTECPNVHPTCGRCFTTAGTTMCGGSSQYQWRLYYDEVDCRWELLADTDAALYTAANFDCMTPTTFTRQSTTVCSGWPATLDVTPAGMATLPSCIC